MTVLVTNAPSSETGKKRCSSCPLAAQPDAVITGLGSAIGPSVVVMSTISGPPPAGRRGRRSGTRQMPSPNASQRTRSPRNTGPSTQERTIRVTPSLPVTGMTQVMHTPTPQAIDSSTATWATAPWAVAISVTERSIAIGPQP